MDRRLAGLFGRALCLSAFLGVGALDVALAAGPPAQPTELKVFHRSGQTFITWSERAELKGEKYRIYRHTKPITAANLAKAQLLYEVSEGSGCFFADRYNPQYSGNWKARYVDRFVILDGRGQLPAETGLLVWTLWPEDFGGKKSGDGYYAVTTILRDRTLGTKENTQQFGADNSVGPVAERVEDPLPVETAKSPSGRIRVFTQFMDLRRWNPTFHAPREANQYYGLSPDDPAVADAIQYAYTYTVTEPDPTAHGGALPPKLPLFLYLHGWDDNTYPPDTDGEEGTVHDYCAVEVRPIDTGETWFFGFARKHDYRKDTLLVPGETIVNYTEWRIMRMIYDVLRHPAFATRVDRNRIYVWGHSMGGSGTLALALRYPNVFAAAYASEPMTNYRTSGDAGDIDWRNDIAPKWGGAGLNLPVQIEGPGDWADHLKACNGTGAWDWQNHQAQIETRLSDEMVPFGVAHGRRDNAIGWATQGQPAYAAFNAGRRVWGGAVTDDEHTWLSFNGLPLPLAVDPSVTPFDGFKVIRNESMPGLSNFSGDLALPPNAVGGYNQAIEWSTSWNPWDGAPVDTAGEWRVSLRTTDNSKGTVDVTPRRLQAFRITAGASYSWENQSVADGKAVASGVVAADAHRLVTVPMSAVSPGGNRLTLRLAGKGAKPTPPPPAPLPKAAPAPAPQPAPAAAKSPAAGKPRPLLDTTDGIHVFNDQISNLSQELVTFCAKRYDGTQKMTRAEADALRAANPNFVILHYRLGMGLGYRGADGKRAPTGDWLQLIDKDWTREWPGDGVVQDNWFFKLNGKRVYHCGWGWYLMELNDPGWREWWTGQVLSQMADNDADGLFADSLSVPNYIGADDYEPRLPAQDAAFEAAWTTRIQDFLAYVHGRFGGRYYLIPNAGEWVTSRDATDYSAADGVMLEGFGFEIWENYGATDWALQLNRVLRMIRQGKAVIAQSYRLDNADVRLFTLATYLLIKGDHTYINLDAGQDPEWWPEYDIPIGAAEGRPPADIGALLHPDSGLHIRRFSNGLVLVNVGGERRMANLDGPYYLARPRGGGTVPPSGVLPAEWTVAYTQVTKVMLDPGCAAIVVRRPPRRR